MNDNESPDNVIDLMERVTGTALIVPDGLHDVVILGFMPDGKLYFNSEAVSLERIALALLLAQQRVARYHSGETGDDDDPDAAA